MNAAATRVAVIVATKGRPQAVSELLRSLEQQTLRPSLVLISATDPVDLEDSLDTQLNLEVIFGTAGSSAQRNRALQKTRNVCDIVIFFDDDFVPAPQWIEHCAKLFAERPDVVGAHGVLLGDGAVTGPIPVSAARRAIEVELQNGDRPLVLAQERNLYGCNMAFRAAAIGDVEFDERLVLYGWMEDKAFSRAVGKRGLLVQCSSMIGVHQGLVRGRVSGKTFGFSQVVNPWYLSGKGTLSRQEAASDVFRALAANALRCLRPEPHIDRVGRLTGNLLALRHLASGSCRPEEAAQIRSASTVIEGPALTQRSSV